MKMKRFFFAALFLMSGLTIVPAQVKLSFNPPKGAKYEYQTEMIQDAKQSVMGQEIPVETEVSMNYLMEIMDKTPQETTVQITYQEVAYIISSPMMNMGYDSKNPIENPSDFDQMLAKMFSKILGQSFVLVIAPDGSVKSVTGMDAIGESMSSAIASDGQMIAQLGAQMKLQFNDDAMKNTFEQSFKIYPADAVRTGNSWNTKNTMTVNGMNTDISTKYTLKSVSRNVATIAVEGEVEMTPGAGMEGKVAGTQSGTMTVDTGTGLSLTGDVSQNIKGALKVQGMDVQMEMKTKMKTSIKEVK